MLDTFCKDLAKALPSVRPAPLLAAAQDLQEFQEIFNLVDTDRGGSIGTEELARRPAQQSGRRQVKQGIV